MDPTGPLDPAQRGFRGDRGQLAGHPAERPTMGLFVSVLPAVDLILVVVDPVSKLALR